MREPWGKANFSVFVARPYKQEWVENRSDVPREIKRLRGVSDHKDYRDAKYGGDPDAALRVVRACLDKAYLGRMKMIIDTLKERGMEEAPFLACPYKEGGNNKLARAATVHLGRELGLDVDAGVIERTKGQRKELTILERLEEHALFEGVPVTADGKSLKGRYAILVDDNLRGGSTFADLRGHLLGNGCRAAFGCALSTPDGSNKIISPATQQIDELRTSLTNDAKKWLGNVIRGGILSLTRSEADILGKSSGRRELESLIENGQEAAPAPIQTVRRLPTDRKRLSLPVVPEYKFTS